MPLYRSPLQPYDPIIRQAGTTAFSYLRDNFYGSGQDSYTRPFEQSQELFQNLTNVLPVARGGLQLRYGYQLFNNPALTLTRMYSYQNVSAGIRKLIMIGGSTIDVCNEDGTSISNIITANATNPRLVNSRDYALIPASVTTTTWPSGQKTDGKKWHSVQGLSDFGLANPAAAVNVTSTAVAGNITLVSTAGRVYAGAFQNSTTGHYSDLNVGIGSFATGTAGPDSPSSGTTVAGPNPAWTNPGNILVQDGVNATCSVPATGLSNFLQAKGFGFAIPGTATIYGILVTIVRAGASAIVDNSIQLLKAGTPTGSDKANTTDAWPAILTSTNYGGANDLWGTTWTPADINDANFGAELQASNPTPLVSKQASVDYVSITVTYATGTGSNTGAIAAKQVSLSLPVTSPPTGVDKFAILATLDGGDTSTFYLLDTVPIAQTTYTDNTPDNVLVTKNRATEVDDFGIEHGLVNNDPPPLGLQFPTKHKGRIYGAIGENLFFSKNLDEITTSTGLVLGRYEEAWPATNSLPVSTEEETIRGLLSDGTTLYIGTERHVWRLDGDSPLNFSKPEVIFNEVGILNQDSWKVVYSEGAPVGMIWLTPDFRVIHSNFATYTDIGTPIQDVLNTCNASATFPAWGEFFTQQGYDVFILAIPTGSDTAPDTLCVYDMRGQRWYIWKTADQLTYGLFNINLSGTPQWLVGAGSGKTYQFLPTAKQDRVNDTPVAISVTITTPWLHLGEPTHVKALNEVEVITQDANMLVTVQGASTQSLAVTAPNTVVSSAPLTLSPRGFYKLYLAGNTSKDRFYQFTFTSSAGLDDVLMSFVIEAVPIPY